MERLKRIVDICGITEQRQELESNKQKILKIKKRMSDLTINRNVALYAYDHARLKELITLVINEKKDELRPELARLRTEIDLLLEDEDVLEYQRLMYEVKEMELDNHEYFKSININLRGMLIEDDNLPNIVVYQGLLTNTRLKLYRNIIDPGIITTGNPSDILITPKFEFTSGRKQRHFYSHTSFHYLEQLSQDYEYGLEGKKIPGTRILVKK